MEPTMTRNRNHRRMNRWMALQRERALTLLALRKLNQSLENIRPALRNPPLDGYTIKLGGTDETPGISGLWLEHYLDCALSERIIDEEELQPA
jgi:hypothetical protein